MSNTYKVDLGHRVAKVVITTPLTAASDMDRYVDEKFSRRLDKICLDIMNFFKTGDQHCYLEEISHSELKALKVILVPLGYLVSEILDFGRVTIKRA